MSLTRSHLVPFVKRASLSFVLMLSSILISASTSSAATVDKGAEILWDTYDVPHIFAKDAPDLFYAFGWAQMQNHGNLILRLYGQGRGRAAEYWGQKYLESDRWVQTMSIPERAQEWYKAQSPYFRNYLDAFAAGINDYVRAHPDLIDADVKAVLPVNGVDVLAHTQRVINFTFVVDQGSVANLARTKKPLGSNAWAIAPSRSATGNAMLLASPHLYWSDLFLWFEAHLTGPGINAYGATLVGFPTLGIAFNDSLGWSHTVNTYRGWTLYELELAEGGYRLDGNIRAFETKEKTLKVKQADGSLRQEPLVVRYSLQGPVVIHRDGKAFALRVAGLDKPGALEQWWKMGRATNLSEFEAAVQGLQIPMFTVMYADRKGHIMHLFNGQVPIRNSGNAEYWAGIVPGNISTNIWTKTHPYRDLPRVVDPPSGWLQNANDPPWTTTFPSALNPDKYPPYMAPRGPMSLRAQRSARMLMADEKMSLEEMVQNKFSTFMEVTDHLLNDLILAARQSSSPVARKAAEVLSAWDRKADADSRGAVLFAYWLLSTNPDQLFATRWDERAPLTTPHGLANPAGAVATLEKAAAKVESTYGALDVKWGDVFRLRSDRINLPANGADNPFGVFPSIWFTPTKDNHFAAIGGDSYTALVEFSKPVRAKVLNIYGNATQPNSTHKDEQLKLFTGKQLRPAWRTRKEIMDNLFSQDRCNYTQHSCVSVESGNARSASLDTKRRATIETRRSRSSLPR